MREVSKQGCQQTKSKENKSVGRQTKRVIGMNRNHRKY